MYNERKILYTARGRAGADKLSQANKHNDTSKNSLLNHQAFMREFTHEKKWE